MKKLLAILLAITCVFSFATISISATEANTKVKDFETAIQQFSRDYLFDCMGNVALGDNFNTTTAAIYTATMETWVFPFDEDFVNPWEDYKVVYTEGSEYQIEESYYVVPEEEFFSKVEKYFALSDENKAAFKDMPMYIWAINPDECIDSYNPEDKTFTVEPSRGGGPKASIYRGYTYSGTPGIYDVYSILVDYMDGLDAPSEDMIEWTDYYHEVGDGYEYFYNTYKVIKSRVQYNGDIVKFLSYEEIEAMPEFIITEESAETKTEKDNITVEAKAGVFPTGTEITVDEIKDGEKHNDIKTALSPNGDKFIAFDINAYTDNVKVQPDGEVKITLEIPENYDADKVEAYHITEDNKLETVKYEVFKNIKCVVLTVNHFSIYTLVEINDTTQPTIDNTTSQNDNSTQPTIDNATSQNDNNTQSAENTSPKTGDNSITLLFSAVLPLAFVAIKKFKY